VLDNANLAGAVLCHVDLRGANLLRANFSGAVLIDVDLRDANLVGVSFRDAVMVDVKTERAEIAGATIAEIQGAGSTLVDVFQRLRHLPAEHSALLAAMVLMRASTPKAAEPTSGAMPQGDPLATLLRQSFAGMVRELQGRGGPPELGRLRVDGEHVYATSTTGDEVRLTSADRAAPRQAPQMRVPDPPREPAAPAPTQPAASNPAPAASAFGSQTPSGRFSGLEID